MEDDFARPFERIIFALPGHQQAIQNINDELFRLQMEINCKEKQRWWQQYASDVGFIDLMFEWYKTPEGYQDNTIDGIDLIEEIRQHSLFEVWVKNHRPK